MTKRDNIQGIDKTCRLNGLESNLIVSNLLNLQGYGSLSCRANFGAPRPGFLPTLRVQAPLLKPCMRQRTQVFMHTGLSRCQGDRTKFFSLKAKTRCWRRVPLETGPEIGERIGTTFERSNPVAVAPDARPRRNIPSAQLDLKVPLCCLNVLATILLSQASRCNDNRLLRGQTGQVLDSPTHARVLSTRVSVD